MIRTWVLARDGELPIVLRTEGSAILPEECDN
jgi:hypothetical protein